MPSNFTSIFKYNSIQVTLNSVTNIESALVVGAQDDDDDDATATAAPSDLVA